MKHNWKTGDQFISKCNVDGARTKGKTYTVTNVLSDYISYDCDAGYNVTLSDFDTIKPVDTTSNNTSNNTRTVTSKAIHTVTSKTIRKAMCSVAQRVAEDAGVVFTVDSLEDIVDEEYNALVGGTAISRKQ